LLPLRPLSGRWRRSLPTRCALLPPGATPRFPRVSVGLAPATRAQQDAYAPRSWPAALRKVRGGSALWSRPRRCWRAWSTAPPPAELQALLDSAALGRPLNAYPRC